MIEFTFTKADIKQDFSSGDYEIILKVPERQKTAVQAFCDLIGNNDKPLIAKIDKKRNKRSLDANAYMWVLCTKIAEKIGSTKEIVYLKNIREVGRFEDTPIKDEAVEYWINAWNHSGIGWHSEVSHKSKIDGYTVVRNYYGSSVYDTKEMCILIDSVVLEAKEQGIDTMTPREIEELLKKWGGN